MAAAARRETPAQRAKPSAVVGPKTWRCRRASSRCASAGSTSGAGTVHTVGARAPSQRIATVPVVAAYRNELGLTSSAAPASRSDMRAPARWARSSAAIRSARSRPLASSGSLPSEKTAKSAAATT